MVTADEVDARMDTHEAVCAVRYEGIIARVGRLEAIVLATTGAILCGMAGLIVTLFFMLSSKG